MLDACIEKTRKKTASAAISNIIVSHAPKFECWNPSSKIYGVDVKGTKDLPPPGQAIKKLIPSAQNASLPRKVLSLEWKASTFSRLKDNLSLWKKTSFVIV